MKTITSNDNKILKMCLQLKNKKYRERLGKYLIEGPNLIEEALKNNVIPEILIIDERSEYNLELLRLSKLYTIQTNELENGSVLVCEEKLFQKLAQTENSQGILGIVKKKSFKEEEFFGCCKKGSGNILVLDRLQDPGNVGTIIRTADAAGYDGIMALKGTVDIFSSKVVRACTGSLFRIPILFVDSAEIAIQLLKKYGKRVISTGLETDKYYFQIDLKQDVGLVIGNEGNGICEKFKLESDEIIKIPMSGSIESLNASVAASILMYEAMRN